MEHQNAVITLCYSSLYWKADGHDAALHGLSYMYVTAILSQNSRRGLVALHGYLLEGTDGMSIKHHFVASAVDVTSSQTGLEGILFGSTLLLLEFVDKGIDLGIVYVLWPFVQLARFPL